MRRLILLVLLSLISCLNIFADDLTTGCYYYEHEDYAQALPYLQRAAKAGYGEACLLLGNMYCYGKGTEVNYSIAKTMYERSLQFGYNRGEAELGMMYENGYGVAENKGKAIELYQKSADRGLSIGKYLLAITYWNEETSDDKLIFELLTSVRNAEDTDPLPYDWNNITKLLLGMCYEFGYGVDADYYKAIYLYKNNNRLNWRYLPACYRAFLLYYANNDKQWSDWLYICIKEDEKEYGTGDNYFLLFDESGGRADGYYSYLLKAAQKNYGPAQRVLAECYRTGKYGISINLNRAQELDKMADEWFAKNGEEYEKERKMKTDSSYRRAQGVFKPGEMYHFPSGKYSKVKYVNSKGVPIQ